MQVNLDLHIHSRYSTAVSQNMEPEQIALGAAKKGVKIVGTGDCLHPLWLESIKKLLETDGLYRLDDIFFLLSVEVEDSRRVHHLIFLPDISKAEELQEAVAPYSSNLEHDGRPKLHLLGAEIADLALEAGGLIGPSHAFTPWTGVYAHYQSLEECYLEKAGKIGFIELGLSADSDYADRIAELSSRTFLSNSDAHSPQTNKLAREFNRMELGGYSFEEVARGINRESGRKPLLNVGFFPEEGKYNRTACIRCYRQYSAKEMNELSGRCPVCRGQIKLGVSDRVSLLADYDQPVHPPHRPGYLHIVPLAEIIALALGHKGTQTAGVQRQYAALTENRTEIEVLLEADLMELEAIAAVQAEPKVARAIEAFRQGKVEVIPGGGGKYGVVRLPEDKIRETGSEKQKSLFDFEAA